jgi:hypothetical protein
LGLLIPMHTDHRHIDFKEGLDYLNHQMNLDELIGFAVIVVALLVTIALALWSRWRINRIAKSKLGTLRDIQQDLRRER